MSSLPIAELLVGAVLGTVFSILTTIFTEWLRSPCIAIKLIDPRDLPLTFMKATEDPPAAESKNVRFLSLHIENKALPKGFRWLNRNTAMSCQGYISFHHLDGQNKFGRVMQPRWAGVPEPEFPWFVYAGKQTVIVDPVRLRMGACIDIRPGVQEGLDVVVRFHGEEECYGWNNESYYSSTPGKNLNWQLPLGRYLVKVDIETSGTKVTRLYRLINDVKVQDFRLIPALKEDKARD